MTGVVFLRIPEYPNHRPWMDDAACTPDPRWTADTKPKAPVLAELAAICHTCPVQADCAAYALDHTVHGGMYAGVWLPHTRYGEWFAARRALQAKTRSFTGRTHP